MTSKEAINYLKSSGMTEEQIVTVINALTCDDCISRTETLKYSHIEYDDDGEGHRVIYAEDIKELPSVTPKTSEDYISKTALLARIDEERKHLLDLKMDGAEHIIVHHARRIIEDMPVVAGSEGKNDL